MKFIAWLWLAAAAAFAEDVPPPGYRRLRPRRTWTAHAPRASANIARLTPRNGRRRTRGLKQNQAFPCRGWRCALLAPRRCACTSRDSAPARAACGCTTAKTSRAPSPALDSSETPTSKRASSPAKASWWSISRPRARRPPARRPWARRKSRTSLSIRCFSAV